MTRLALAQDFSRTPGSRYAQEGPFSGEQFRKEILAPMVRAALSAGDDVEINLDGTAGYGTSFLEEAFGGLIRNDHFSLKELNRVLRFVSTEEDYLVEDIKGYMQDAEEQRQSEGPQ